MPSYEEKCNLVKMSINEKWYLVKLTQAWPDGHLINQLAKALIESNSELLSLREQLEVLKALPAVAWRNRFTGYLHSNKPAIVDDCYDELFTAAKPVNVSVIQDELIEQVGVMCDLATNIHEKNIYGEVFCALKYGILPYLRNKENK